MPLYLPGAILSCTSVWDLHVRFTINLSSPPSSALYDEEARHVHARAITKYRGTTESSQSSNILLGIEFKSGYTPNRPDSIRAHADQLKPTTLSRIDLIQL
jgi:hypothetical protein